MLRIALASPPISGTTDAALPWVERFVAEAAAGAADVVCFPECYVPGLRGVDFEVEPHSPVRLEAARDRVCQLARQYGLQVIMPMEWGGPDGVLNVAFVISGRGEVMGCQTKNQIAPEEDPHYVPGCDRQLFTLKGVTIGIVICHEGWRYPESVRWAAVRGALIVFHPHHAGGNGMLQTPAHFCAAGSPYYEKAMICRSLENGVYFASVGYALADQEAATALIAPDGHRVGHLPYGEPAVLFADVDPSAASLLYASRFAADRYQ